MRTKLRSKFTLLLIVCAALIAVPGAAALAQDTGTSPAPTIQSDKADYAPGELVTLTGSGWQAGESVNIVVNDNVGQTWSYNHDVTADASGNISDSFNLPDWFVAAYSVTATGSSGTATTSFTDVRVVTTATLNGGNSVNVTPGGSITADVTVERSGSGANARCESTGWSIGTTEPGSFNCVDHTDYTNNAVPPLRTANRLRSPHRAHSERIMRTSRRTTTTIARARAELTPRASRSPSRMASSSRRPHRR